MNLENKKYLKILFKPFFAEKKTYIEHIILNIIMLFISLGSIELIRKLINSVEQNAGFNVTLKYGIYVIILIFLLLIGNMYKVKYRPINLINL